MKEETGHILKDQVVKEINFFPLFIPAFGASIQTAKSAAAEFRSQ